jgi:hypothetical protein
MAGVMPVLLVTECYTLNQTRVMHAQIFFRCSLWIRICQNLIPPSDRFGNTVPTMNTSGTRVCLKKGHTLEARIRQAKPHQHFWPLHWTLWSLGRMGSHNFEAAIPCRNIWPASHELQAVS